MLLCTSAVCLDIISFNDEILHIAQKDISTQEGLKRQSMEVTIVRW